MVFRVLINYLIQQQRVIERLAESAPMRAAARMVAYGLFRGKYMSESAVKKLKVSSEVHDLKSKGKEVGNKAHSFTKTFFKEVRDGFKKINEDMERKQK